MPISVVSISSSGFSGIAGVSQNAEDSPVLETEVVPSIPFLSIYGLSRVQVLLGSSCLLVAWLCTLLHSDPDFPPLIGEDGAALMS